MKHRLVHWFPILALLVTLAGSLPALADGREGMIDFLDLKNMNIVVDDFSLVLAPSYVVKNSAGKVVSAFNLSKGKRVDFITDSDGRVIEVKMK